MKRNATLNLKGLDPDVLDAARDVARRAGIPLETWIASVVPPEDRPHTRRKRRPAQPEASASLQPASASPELARTFDTAAPGPALAPPANAPLANAPLAKAPSPPPETRQPTEAADAFTASIAQMLRRLDAIDEKIEDTHKAAQEAATSSVAGIEARLSSVLDGGLPPAAAMGERLALIERRMTELGEQVAQPRPLGRRGRPVALEMADAVGEIRQRQRELDERDAHGAAGHGPVAALQQNVAAGMSAAPHQAPSPMINELQAETSRLRESIGGLATGQDVHALEEAMLSLATGVQHAQKPADLAAIVRPIEMIQIQVSRLADDVAENVHARVVGDVERLAAKFDRALSAGASGHADRDALGGLFAEIEEIRRLIAALAGPERIQSLAQGLQAISAQIAKLQGDTAEDASRMAELRPLLEEIRSDLKTPKGDAMEQQIQAMGKALDALRSQAPGGTASSEAIIDRIDALADKVNPVGDLIDRLEGLGETLRRPVVPGGDLVSIHAMLHDLADKVDRVGGDQGSRDGLNALEKQIVALSKRIDTRGSDPAIANLERAMKDLLAQVAAPAVGRDGSELGSLRASLAELRAQQLAAEQRMQTTLNGVHATLDRLTAHFTGSVAAAPMQAAADPKRAEAPAAQRRPERPRMPAAAKPETSAEWSRAKDEILEPGAGRPNRASATVDGAEPDTAAPSSTEIKSNFIAAARRAALAAQAEAAEISPRDRLRATAGQRPASPDAVAPDDGARIPTRVAQLRAGIDRRRKHLLLGLAAIVLALGAIQAVRVWSPGGEPQSGSPATAAVPDASPAKATMPAAETIPATPSTPSPAPAGPAAEPPRLDPQTTQSIATPSETSAVPAPAAESSPSGSKPAQPAGRRGAPKVAELGALANDLAGLPPALATLKKQVLEGDGAAVYELAAREAEGRGVTRDLAMAAKLFEKLAASGYAPAQHKLAGQYEKGLGVTRDVAQAKLWYGRAAEQGNVRAMHNLAVIYAENPAANGKPDFATAAQWFKRGAEYGVRDSQYNLAVLHARGLGVPQDLVQSYLWFSAAAAQGDDDAGRKRDDVAGKLAAKDLATARAAASAFKAKPVDPAPNEAPSAAPAAMTLLGAPAPAATVPPRRI